MMASDADASPSELDDALIDTMVAGLRRVAALLSAAAGREDDGLIARAI